MALKIPDNMSNGRYKFFLWKSYYETGQAIWGNFRHIITLLGLSTLNFADKLSLGNLEKVIFFGIIDTVICLFIGHQWYKYGMIESGIDFGNSFNSFVEEMRKAVIKKDE